jgi:hypothetical protein
MLAMGTANAADPASGTLSKSKKSLKWSGSFTLSQPNPVTADCVGGASDPICDHFMLKVNLGDGARIRVEVPVPNGTTDFDLHVYGPTGNLVGSSANSPGENEIVEFRHSARYRNKAYEVRVVPWLVVPGTTYSGTAKVK